MEHNLADDDNSPSSIALIDSLRFENIDNRFINIRSCHTETCRWFLQSSEYLDWLHPTNIQDHHGFFWIKGKPGSGKSTLMKFALANMKRSQNDTTYLSFFFNARGTQLEKSATGMYRSLLVQLLENARYSKRVWSALRSTHWLSEDQLMANCEMLKHLLARGVQTIENVAIIIDALDECHEDEVRDMVAFFERLSEDAISDRRTFRVLYSSRHYPHITTLHSMEMVLENQEGHSQDIANFVSTELKAGRSQVAALFRRELSDRASGIFLWVVLVVQILNKAFDHGQIHALRKKLNQIPVDLSKLFRGIITQDKQNLDELKLCLQWVLFAHRPLKREGFYYAVLSGIDPNHAFLPWDPEKIPTESMALFILSASKGLVEITKKDHTVQFIHQSVRDFLLEENVLGQVWPDLNSNAIGLSHDCLKQGCSNYMRLGTANVLDDPEFLAFTSSSNSASADLYKDIQVKFPFLEYAAHNIFAHADTAQLHGVSQERFLTEIALSKWVELFNAIERYQARRLPRDIDLIYVLAEQNCSSLIDTLTRDGSRISSQNGRYGNPIFAAIAMDSQKAFESLVRRDSEAHPDGCEFPYPSEDICSFLVKHGRPETIRRFLSIYDVDITSTLKSGETMLLWAVEWGHSKIVELLLNKGADPNAQARLGSSALHAASSRGYVEIVIMLLNKGADVEGKLGNALEAASYKGHSSIVELLLSKGADVNAQGGAYGGALQAASYGGYSSVVELLVSKGADVNAQGGAYGSVLQAASYRGYSSIVELLLSKGADVNAQGGAYGNALQAASYGGYSSIVELLLSKGADVNAHGGAYGNALQAALHKGDSNIVELLLSKGADVNAQGGKYGSALQAASYRGYSSIVELLLSKGADVNAQGGAYGNALQAASYGEYSSIVELLLSKGADVKTQGRELAAALQFVAKHGRDKRVTTLESSAAKHDANRETSANSLEATTQGAIEIRPWKVAFSSEGKRLVPDAIGATDRLRHTKSKMEMDNLEDPAKIYRPIAWSPGGQLIASALYNGTVMLWDVTLDRPLNRLMGHTGRVKAIAYSPAGNLVASASDDNSVRLWDVLTGSELSTLDGHTDTVNAIDFSLDGQLIVSASKDRTIRVWNVATSTTYMVFKGHTGAVTAALFSPDGQLVASASSDGTIRLWDIKLEAELSTLKGHRSSVNAIAFSPNGQLVASGSDDATVRLWNVVTGTSCSTFEGHMKPVGTVTFSPDGQLLASASNDKTIRFWNVTTSTTGSTLEGHLDKVVAIVFSPNGQLAASSSYDGTVKIWNVKTGSAFDIIEGHMGRVNAIAFSPDGQLLASISDDETVRLWNLVTGTISSKLAGLQVLQNGQNHAVSGSETDSPGANKDYSATTKEDPGKFQSKIDNAVWESHRETIKQLYLGPQGYTLRDLMNILQRDHGFVATYDIHP
jgi:WD40 repeat protein/ankyrin repeat protein